MFADFVDLLGRHPAALFFAIAVLPGVGVPNCPLLLPCGTAMAPALGVVGAVLLAVGAVVANILWAWWVAAYPLRNFLAGRVNGRVGERFRMGERSVLGMTVLLHVTPGVPLFVQNYFPGLHRLRYWKYLAVAIPVQTFYTALIVAGSGQAVEVLKRYSVVLPSMLLVFVVISLRRWKVRDQGEGFGRGRPSVGSTSNAPMPNSTAEFWTRLGAEELVES